ncbi:MAG: acetyl-CoA carboxylase carboxyltransferase subunit alpha [Candidatus Omnitrophica bacterium]|nr:acetyl-CoA carboxylase carboxyltransferase subunit alpha [Candidatus Omnitrophota bacterium]
MSGNGLEFEKPIIELEKKIAELQSFTSGEKMDLNNEIQSLQKKLEQLKKEIYKNLTPWQRVQIARHLQRPYMMDYVKAITQGFIELHGDRRFGDDKAMVGGFATIEGDKVLVIGHQKGRGIKQQVERNFGCAHPEGYRKALRLMKLAEKFDIPIICLIDTPGAYPGVGGEERGQAEAIAVNLREMVSLRTPIVVVVIGEGGSGGALGIGVGDRICVLENAYYSVISPEGCSAILWKKKELAEEAARVLKLTAKDLLDLKIIDKIISEPLGGAHRDYEKAAKAVKEAILGHLQELKKMSKDELIEARYQKYRKIGVFKEPPLESSVS